METTYEQELQNRQPVDLRALLKMQRRETIRKYLQIAGQAVGWKVFHAAFLLGTTERTVRNWIVEAGLVDEFFGQQQKPVNFGIHRLSNRVGPEA